MNADFQKAVDKFDLVGWTSTFLTMRSESRYNARFDCPFCESRRTLNVGKEKKIVRCFRCEGVGHHAWKGRASLVNWIMLLSSCSKFDAVKLILDGSGIIPTVEYIEEEKDYSVPREAMSIATACDPTHPCRVELRRRGMEHLIDKFSVCVSGYYGGRIILPINWMGEYLGFEAKSYCNGTPKSLSNCLPDSLYSTYCWQPTIQQAIITESVFDAETVGVNAVGLLGSSLGEDRFIRFLQLRKLNVDTLVWFLDGDAVAKQLKMMFRWTSLYFKNKVVTCPPKDDPNSLGTSKCWELINAAKLIESEFELCV